MKELSPRHVRALSAAANAAAAVCPSCNASLEFHRSETPAIDACGLESYHLHCDACGTPLAGVIDPADDALLLSAV